MVMFINKINQKDDYLEIILINFFLLNTIFLLFILIKVIIFILIILNN